MTRFWSIFVDRHRSYSTGDQCQQCVTRHWTIVMNYERRWLLHGHIKYSLDFLRPIKTTEAFEAVDWLADLPQ